MYDLKARSAGDGRRPGSGGLMVPNGPMMGQGGEQGGMLVNGVNGHLPPHHAMGNGLMSGHMGGGGGPMGSGMPLMGGMPLGMQGGGGGPLGSAAMMGNGYMANGGGMGGIPPMGMMGVEGGAGDVMQLGGIPPGPLPQVPMPMANGALYTSLTHSTPPTSSRLAG